MTKSWRFSALDTLFFRDGTPFHQGESGNIMPASIFPPSMKTIQGAIRTALARKQGWTPELDGNWPKELGTPDDLGDLYLKGPYLRYKGERLYLTPLVLFGKKEGKKWNLKRLVPGPEVECDLGERRLPMLKKEDRGEGHLLSIWTTKSGLEKILQYQFPSDDEIFGEEQLWKYEGRVGIAIRRETGTAEDKQLYSLNHVRPVEDLEIEVGVSGIPVDWHLTGDHALPMGGEGRFALVRVDDQVESLPRKPDLSVDGDGIVRFTVSLLTPGYYSSFKKVIEEGPPHIPGKCISACIGKVMQVGGWDLKRNRPRKLKPILPPGSTWFYEAAADQLEEILLLHGAFRGEETKYGMGQLVLGVWKDETGGLKK